MKWNPRFVLYAESHGNSPLKQLEKDEVMYPGGMMCGFINWVNKHSKEFGRKNPHAVHNGFVSDQALFDKFLKNAVNAEVLN
jgi:hypothetical protein